LKWAPEDFRRSQNAEEAHFDAASRLEFPRAAFSTRTLGILMPDCGAAVKAGVFWPTIQPLIEHSRKKTGGATAIYTQGQRVDLRAAIGNLKYTPRIMRLIEAPTNGETPALMSAAGKSRPARARGHGPILTPS
jgi:hypothetical protein